MYIQQIAHKFDSPFKVKARLYQAIATENLETHLIVHSY